MSSAGRQVYVRSIRGLYGNKVWAWLNSVSLRVSFETQSPQCPQAGATHILALDKLQELPDQQLRARRPLEASRKHPSGKARPKYLVSGPN